MTNSRDHRTSTTDLLPKRATRRHRAPQRAATTPQTAPPPYQPTPASRRSDRRADARPTQHVNPENGHLRVVEPDGPLHAMPAPLANVVTLRQPSLVEHELTVVPGATAADVTTAMIMISPGATLVGHRSGAGRSVSLLFREPPESPDGAAGRPVTSA